LKNLEQITVAGDGLLGGSIGRAVLRRFPGAKSLGCTDRSGARRGARELPVVREVVSDVKESVSQAGLVILGASICMFEQYFAAMAAQGRLRGLSKKREISAPNQ
jgi:prephenate dehydrogenase